MLKEVALRYELVISVPLIVAVVIREESVEVPLIGTAQSKTDVVDMEKAVEISRPVFAGLVGKLKKLVFRFVFPIIKT